MENFVAAGIMVLLIGMILFYLISEKKKGRRCVGCPYAKQCGNRKKKER